MWTYCSHYPPVSRLFARRHSWVRVNTMLQRKHLLDLTSIYLINNRQSSNTSLLTLKTILSCFKMEESGFQKSFYIFCLLSLGFIDLLQYKWQITGGQRKSTKKSLRKIVFPQQCLRWMNPDFERFHIFWCHEYHLNTLMCQITVKVISQCWTDNEIKSNHWHLNFTFLLSPCIKGSQMLISPLKCSYFSMRVAILLALVCLALVQVDARPSKIIVKILFYVFPII